LSHYVNAQNVFSIFTDTVVIDDFKSPKSNFPQKYTSSEISIIENGQYRLKRLSDQDQSISYLKTDQPIHACEVIAEIEIASGSNNGGGVVLYGQTNTNGAIFLQLNEKRQFRIYKQSESKLQILSGSAKGNGWLKNKNLASTGKNTIRVKMENGYIDIYFNNHYVYTAFDTEYTNGRIGVFAENNSEIILSNFIVLSKKGQDLKAYTNPTIESSRSSSSVTSTNSDPAFEEVILLFKTKIDQQQVQISQLQNELDKCKSLLNYDTSLVTRSQELLKVNRKLTLRLDSTNKVLNQDKKRLEYLESLKEDIEKGSNGDLVISLTTILADIKKDHQVLIDRTEFAEENSKALKTENEVLLREIKRLKYIIDTQK
jgi:hypothetical protein